MHGWKCFEKKSGIREWRGLSGEESLEQKPKWSRRVAHTEAWDRDPGEETAGAKALRQSVLAYVRNSPKDTREMGGEDRWEGQARARSQRALSREF